MPYTKRLLETYLKCLKPSPIAEQGVYGHRVVHKSTRLETASPPPVNPETGVGAPIKHRQTCTWASLLNKVPSTRFIR